MQELRQKEHVKGLGQQIEDMLISQRLDYRQIIKELEYECVCSELGGVEIVGILRNIRLKQADNKMLQKLINHYAKEYKDMIILKPGKA